MPNGTGFRQDHRAVMVPFNDVSDEDTRKDYRMEELKFNDYLHPRGAGIHRILDQNGNRVNPAPPGAPEVGEPTKDSDLYKIVNIEKDYTIEYRIGKNDYPTPLKETTLTVLAQAVFHRRQPIRR